MRRATIGVGGPVGSGKTALLDSLCTQLRDRYSLAVITNDKLSVTTPYSAVPLSRVTRAVVEADADEAEARALAEAGIDIIRAI